jgi:pimeloyl-ACP methyl ester carboxylesterase
MLRRVVRKRVMQQRIGFCSTEDGARIAYATVGTGPALVVSRQPISHLGLEWEEPRFRDFWETVGQHYMVVRYDRHGCGLSDRNRTDFSLDFEVRTIEAIVKGLELESFVLWGQGGMGAAADRHLPTLASVRALYPEAARMSRESGARISIRARAAFHATHHTGRIYDRNRFPQPLLTLALGRGPYMTGREFFCHPE